MCFGKVRKCASFSSKDRNKVGASYEETIRLFFRRVRVVCWMVVCWMVVGNFKSRGLAFGFGWLLGWAEAEGE